MHPSSHSLAKQICHKIDHNLVTQKGKDRFSCELYFFHNTSTQYIYNKAAKIIQSLEEQIPDIQIIAINIHPIQVCFSFFYKLEILLSI